MRCRHTVADWHRYVVAGEDGPPIYAACRLLVREGQPAADPRAIACSYWGKQEACPLYEGPRASGPPRSAAAPPAGRVAADIPVAIESTWPVRGPGEPDLFGRVLLVLSVASIVAGAAAAGLVIGVGARAIPWLLMALGLSLTTHILTALRVWAGR